MNHRHRSDHSLHYRTCPLCEATCGLEVTVEGDAVVRIRGDRDDVFSHGFICPKGTTLKQLHEDPDRLRAPLVKRDGRHVEVSWDEAFAEVERRLLPVIEEHGREAAAVYLGNPNVHNHALTIYGRALIMTLGTRSVYTASTVDQMPRHVSSGFLYGDPLAIPLPDLDRTDYLLMLGANPYHSNGSLATAPDFPGRLQAIREQLRFLDARLTKDSKASFHLEMDAYLQEADNMTNPHHSSDPFNSDEWENIATDVKQTTLTHAHLHEPGDAESPDPGDPDHWQINVGVDIADFDFNGDGSNGAFDGVDDAKVFILGSHVEGPHDDDVDPQTLPLAISAFGRDKDNDDGVLRLVKSASVLHPTATGNHRDRYSVSMSFKVSASAAEILLLGVLAEREDDPDAKEVVVDAEHVTIKNTSFRDGRTFGTTEGAAFFTASTGSLSFSLGGVDIVPPTCRLRVGDGFRSALLRCCSRPSCWRWECVAPGARSGSVRELRDLPEVVARSGARPPAGAASTSPSARPRSGATRSRARPA